MKWDNQTMEIDFIDNCKVLKKGSRVYTKSIEGVYMETEYLTFESPSEISIKMINTSKIFRDFAGTWNYYPTKESETVLKITYTFELKFPYNIIKHIVCKKIRNNIKGKLESLNEYLNVNEG